MENNNRSLLVSQRERRTIPETTISISQVVLILRLMFIPHYLSRNLILPGAPLLYWPVERNSSGIFTVVNATTTIPTLIRMQNNWRLSFLGLRDKNVYLTDLNTNIACLADFCIKDYRRVWSGYIRQSVNI